ncbi:Lem3p Ecym_2018 [Eremothecium cymbalariae DBVPG|uniref:Cell division control protein 50 n=1 Tax=Eremothecium cymbalariae (strain CBS 270.75 / DBVPG 7215 / KCTC 17166 / NRRL Y-17582) TaxID=931890 RepID=G8JNX7_ERECY|nr:Hypothetical protein Ecym_2018 [Eremothecium cymbalariae DBVPG\
MAGIKLSNVGIFRKKDKELYKDRVEEEDADVSDFEDEKPKKVSSRRPKETRFTQQRIGAVNLIVKPATVIPLYLILAIFSVVIGAVLFVSVTKVDEFIIYYHNCASNASLTDFQDIPSDQFSYSFHKEGSSGSNPQWKYVEPEDPSEDGSCRLRFSVPYDLEGPIYVSYLIENFYANHRRFVLSFSEDQIKGLNASYEDVHGSVGINCRPLIRNEEGKLYYPCGLIANSMFNDTFPFSLTGVNGASDFPLTNKGINWPDDKNRFKKTQYSPDDVTPPPYWKKQFPDGYNEENLPDLHEWEEFQNWMRTSTLPKFSKLIRRNDNDTLSAGTYEMEIGLHWPVDGWKDGKKAVYITNSSSIGGKNKFLPIIYLVGGGLCCIIALFILFSYVFARRKIADWNLLSWNRTNQ